MRLSCSYPRMSYMRHRRSKELGCTAKKHNLVNCVEPNSGGNGMKKKCFVFNFVAMHLVQNMHPDRSR